MTPPLLEVQGLGKRYGAVAAVREATFTLHAGEAVGLVGPSGCGKSTLALMLARLIPADQGRIRFDGQDIGAVPPARAARMPWRRRVQMVFQDPAAALNPRETARQAVATPLQRLCGLRGEALRAAAGAVLDRVGLESALYDRLPHQLSGGQRARVCIARAIAPDPDLLLLDEPTAALDVSVQAGVLHLLDGLRRERGLSVLFISHDAEVIRLTCSRVLRMQNGWLRNPADSPI